MSLGTRRCANVTHGRQCDLAMGHDGDHTGKVPAEVAAIGALTLSPGQLRLGRLSEILSHHGVTRFACNRAGKAWRAHAKTVAGLIYIVEGPSPLEAIGGVLARLLAPETRS